MEQKHKFYAGLLFCIFLGTLFTGYGVGYSAGYHEAEELYEDSLGRCINAIIERNDEYGRCVDLLERCNATLEECVRQSKKEEVNHKLELLEKGYDNGWWNTSWSKRYRIEKVSGIWIYYTENCTEEQISEFVKGSSSSYDDFSECYIGRSG